MLDEQELKTIKLAWENGLELPQHLAERYVLVAHLIETLTGRHPNAASRWCNDPRIFKGLATKLSPDRVTPWFITVGDFFSKRDFIVNYKRGPEKVE